MIKCSLCKKTVDLEVAWLLTPQGKTYCGVCAKDRYDEIKQKEGGEK